MNPTPVAAFAELFEGQAVGFADGAVVRGFALDSREVRPGDLFLAIQGVNFDGHSFASQAVASGAVGALAERPVDAPHILVPNLVKALARMALAYRLDFTGPVIGITGSAGKTITKEFTAAALGPLGKILKTEGNRNTEFTAPLLWTNLDMETAGVVVEMGMRGFGQIAHLASFSRPTVGIITNIGYAHMEQVGSRKGIAKAKGELLEALNKDGTAVLWKGDLFLDTLRPKVKSGKIVTFGYTDEADCQILDYAAENWKRAVVRGRMDGRLWEATLPVVGRHIALNAAAALAAAVVAGVDLDAAAEALATADLPPMRMQVMEWSGATVVMDAYNASPPAVVAAIETMKDLPCSGRRLAVIGEMKELGESTEESHRLVGRALMANDVHQVIFLGDATEYCWDEMLKYNVAPDRFQIAHSLDEVTEFLRGVRAGDTVLIKGSRALRLETALDPLTGTTTA